MLLVANAGFVSASLMRELIARDHAFVLRVGGNKTLLRALLPEARFDAHRQVWSWPQQRGPHPPLSLRLIEIETATQISPACFC